MSDDAPKRPTPTPGHGADLMSTPALFALAVVAFVVEIALFVGVGVVFHGSTRGGAIGWGAGVAGTVGVIAFWGLWMAPKAKRRLPTTPRLVVSALLCLFTADGLIQAGYPWWGWFVGIAGIAVVLAQVALPKPDPEPDPR